VPDQSLNGLDLAEVEGILAAGVRVLPVLQQPAGDGGHAGVAGLAPSIDPFTDAIDEIKLDGADRVVPRVENLVTRWSSPGLELQLVVALAQPVVRRAHERRIDNQGSCRTHDEVLSLSSAVLR